MLILDTCVLIYVSLTPERLTTRVQSALDAGQAKGALYCADISLWELAMLMSKGRLDPGCPAHEYIDLVLLARGIEVLPITSEIASTSASLALHADPADRLIAATAICHRAPVVTSDKKLIGFGRIDTVW